MKWILVALTAVLLLAGCETHAPPAPAEVATTSAQLQEIGANQPPTLEQLKAQKATALVMLDSDTCLNSKSMAPYFDALTDNHPDLRFVRTHVEVGSSFPTPTFVVLKDGEVMDQQSGAVPADSEEASHENPLILLNLMARNGLIDQDPWSLLLNAEPAEPPPAWLFPGLGANARLLDGWQMKGQNFKNASFAGASLKNADFTEANLSGVNFSHTNLSGTRLVGASLEGVYWNRTICPDGEVHAEGCAQFPSPQPESDE